MTCWEFLSNLLYFRFSREWRKNFKKIADKNPGFGKTATAKVGAGGILQ
jgi:hypothetical protein